MGATPNWTAVSLAGGALLICSASPAMAQAPSRQAELERRVQELEAALAAVKAEMAASKAQAQAADSRIAAVEAAEQKAQAKVAEIEKAAAPSDGFRVGGTTIKISGYVKGDVLVSRYGAGDTATNAFGRDFYLPSAIPVGGRAGAEDADFDAHVKQTRIWLTTSTPIGGHQLGTHIEGDFQTSPGTQATERTTNGYNFAMRRAFLTYDQLTVGQDWSNFMYTPALPETPDFIGPTEGTVFVRQMQLRYQLKLGAQLGLALAIENPETASVTPASAALVENDDDSLPDVTAKLVWKPGAGELSLAGLLRRLDADTATLSETATGYGLSFAGKVPFGDAKQHDIRFAVIGGKGIGRYLGLNFAPDALFDVTPGASRLAPVSVYGGFVAVRYFLTDKLRINLMGSIQDVDNPRGSLLTSNEQAWSAAANLFYSPVKGLDFGLEYRHAERELVNGQSGDMERIHFVAKQSF